MKILKTNIDNLAESAMLVYKLTKSKLAKSVNKMTDTELDNDYPVDAYLFYEDTNNKGEAIILLSILSGDTVIVAQSQTFRASFEDITEICGDRPFTIQVVTGTSKSGRRYMDCELKAIG